jgi:hypothetical protein
MEQQINNEQAIMQALYAPFPEEMEKVMTLSGVNLKFIPVSEVTNRLIKVLGRKWSREVIECKRDPIDTDWVIAHVRITLHFTDGTDAVIRDGIDGAKIMRTKQGQIVNLGDAYKSAESNAFKKAAQSLGVGLYLSRSADAMDIEDAMEAGILTSHQPEPVETAPKTELEEKWDTFVEITKALTKEQKNELNEFWSTHSGGKPKPTKTTASLDDLQALVVEALRLQFGGKYVDNK